jgi:hypothetical protein
MNSVLKNKRISMEQNIIFLYHSHPEYMRYNMFELFFNSLTIKSRGAGE